MQYNQFQMAGQPWVNIKRRVVCRSATAVTVGQVMALDTTLSSTSTTSGYLPTLGTSTGNSVTGGTGPGGVSLQPIDLLYSGIVTPLGESDTVGQIYCVVIDLLDGTGQDGQDVEVLLCGRCSVNVASATYVVGSLLMMSATETNRNLVAFAAGTTDGQRCLAMVEVGGTTITSATVYFFGFGGMLSSQATTN